MLKKKLLTLACAVGILACGACFAPDLIDRAHRPPPPPHLELNGIHSIRVEVSNASESKHIDPDKLARAIADSINMQNTTTQGHAHIQTGVEAHLPGESQSGEDAVMVVSVLSELPVSKSPPDSAGFQRWQIDFRVSARLSGRDGHAVWRSENEDFTLRLPFSAQSPDDLWSKKYTEDSLPQVLASRLVDRLPHAR